MASTFSAAKFNALAPGERLYTHDGLFLFATPRGAKSWRYQPRLDGKRITLVLGRWDRGMTHDQAHDALRDAKRQLAGGRHPVIEKKVAKARMIASDANTFGSVYQNWYDTFAPKRSESWRFNMAHWFRRFLEPAIGAMPVAEVAPVMVLEAMHAAQKETSLHAAHAVRMLASAVFKRAIMLGMTLVNPARDLTGAIDAHVAGQVASMTLADARRLQAGIEDYDGLPQVNAALLLLLHTALRVSEVAGIERSWVQGATLVIPRSAMKMKHPSRGPHVVPLSRQAVAAVKAAIAADTSAVHLFGGMGTRSKPIAPSTFNRAFGRLEMGVISPHSVRNAFSTWAHDHQIATPEVIEAALDHARGSKIAQAYNRGTLLTQRVALMQKWSDALTRRGAGK